MSTKGWNAFLRLVGLTAAAFVLICSYAFTNSQVLATDTVFTQKGSGILGWHATPYGGSLTEDKFKANVDWIAANFKDYGYQYVDVDGWVSDSTIHNADGYITTYKNDWQHDWKYWADYVHSKGLKLGMYYNPVWVHQSIADDPNNKVVGTDYSIQSLTNPAYMHQTRYLVDPSKPGAEQYVKGMINYYKSVGVDLLKVDFIREEDDAYGPAATETYYRWMREAAGNDMILYYANQKNRNHAAAESQYADIIRASEDYRQDIWYHSSVRNRGKVQDNSWPPAYNIFDGFVFLSDVSGKGKVILDGDFSILSSSTSDAEKKFRIGLLAMAGSSIFIGDNYQNIGQNDVYYKNWEILDMNKRGFVGKPLVRDVKDPLSQIWKGQLPDGTWVVGLFNREDTAQTRSIDFAKDLGLSGNYVVSDMWSHAAVGTMSSYSAVIEPHGSRLIKISKLSMVPYGAVFYGSQQVTLNSLDPQAEIHYTVDGTEPNAGSPLYNGSITIDRSSTLRAKIIKGDGQGYEATAMFIASNIDPITQIAAGITSVATPSLGDTQLLLPTVPSGYSIAIKSSDRANVIQTDGKIIPPNTDTTVKLVFEIRRASDGATAATSSISVVVPGINANATLLLEGETLPYTMNPSTLATKINSEAAASGGKNLQITFTQATNQWVEFTANVPALGTYNVVFGYKKNNSRGIFQLNVDGSPLGDPVDQYIDTAYAAYFSTNMGNVTFDTAGNHKFRFNVVGKNPMNTKTPDFVIDYIQLTPQGVSSTIASLVPVSLTTEAGTAPLLPSVVTAVYTDNTTKAVPVAWDAINPAQYAVPGSLTVEGAVYGTTIKAVANITVTEMSPETVAAKITSIPAPAKDATKLILPTVPSGFEISIQSSLNTNVIKTNGTIVPPDTDTTVMLVLEVLRKSDGMVADTDFIPVLVPAKSNVVAPTATLTGANAVVAGQSFDLTYGLSHVFTAGYDSIYAQDVMVNYDPAQFQLSSVTSLINGMFVSQSGTPGHIRIIAASQGAAHAIDSSNSGAILKLSFKANGVLQSAAGAVEVASVTVSDGNGVEKQVQGATQTIQITVVDKTELNTLIANAQAKHDAAVEGTRPGQYPAGSKAALLAAIRAAGAVTADPAATSVQVTQAVHDLNASLQSFLASVNASIPGDVNGDGKVTIGDLAIVASHYGETTGSANWLASADVNGDGVIDIVDLTIVAQKISSQ